MTERLQIFVGYDIREHLAWLVCKDSLYRPINLGKNDRPISVTPLAHKQLRRDGLFWRSWNIDGSGQTYDAGDERPFSTEFAHSRFLTPHIAMTRAAHGDAPYGWAMFVDCDFMFRRPVTDVLKDLDSDKALYVVKREIATIDEGVKMDGMLQQRYYRKLWSSLILWNLDHPKVRDINWVDVTNNSPGSALHGLMWFSDDEIGQLDPTWNWIPGMDAPKGSPAAVHWSLGGPWMEGMSLKKDRFDLEWDERLNEVISHMACPDRRFGMYDELLPLL